MFSKVVAVIALIACVQAIELGHATSFSSVTSHVSPVTKIAPVAHVAHITPVAHVAPVAHIAHVAPVAHIAPVSIKTSQTSSYSSVNNHIAHSAPVVHIASIAPAAHYAPVTQYTPAVKAIHKEVYADAHPQYSFEYGVKDAHTHDIKNQHEERDGDVVKGYYILVQPDGVTRIVHYTADQHNGFNAHVEYKGHASHPEVHHKLVATKAILASVYH